MNLYIMAGGQGSRLGQDKPALSVGGQTVLASIVRRLSPLFRDILVVGGSEESARLLGLRYLADAFTGGGPLGGMATSLKHAGTAPAFVMAGDMPFVSGALAAHMVNALGSEDVLVPVHQGFMEPLFAVYRPTCLPVIQNLLEQGRRKISAFYHAVQWRPVVERTIWRFGHPEVLFFNINTPTDLRDARRLAGPHRRGVVRNGREVPVLCVTGWSGAGKTRLAGELITAYSRQGWHVAALKHAAGGFQMDREGTDTAHFTSQGACSVGVVSPEGWALQQAGRIDLAQLLQYLDKRVDLVIAEGFTREGWPQLEVVGEASTLRTPGALGFVVRTGSELAPFPCFRWEQLPAIQAHINLMLGIEMEEGSYV